MEELDVVDVDDNDFHLINTFNLLMLSVDFLFFKKIKIDVILDVKIVVVVVVDYSSIVYGVHKYILVVEMFILVGHTHLRNLQNKHTHTHLVPKDRWITIFLLLVVMIS